MSADRLLYKSRQEDIARYSNLDSYDKSMRIAALQDMRLDPNALEPYDGFMNSLQRWKNLATSDDMKKMTPEQRQTIASNYFDSQIAHQYNRLGAKPIDKKIWMSQAFDRALKWNMEDGYDSGLRRGIYQGYKDYENIMHTGMSVMGGVMHDMYNVATHWSGDDPVIQQMRKDVKEKGMYGHWKGEAEAIPVLGSTMRSLDRQISRDSFWHDINPSHHWGDGVESWIVEQAMMMPLYRATGKFTSGVISGLAPEMNLTKILSTHNLGPLVTHLLTNGAEGAAYGYTMRDEGDKHNAWQDAIMQAVVGTMFHVGGEKLKNNGLASEAERARLDAAKQNMKPASLGDLREPNVRSMAGDMAAGGRPAVYDIITHAMKFVHENGHLSHEDFNATLDKLIKSDPAKYKSMGERANYIRKYLEEHFPGKQFSTLEPHEKRQLFDYLGDMMDEAGKRAPEVVEPITQKAGADAVKNVKQNPKAQEIIAKFTKEIMDENAKQGVPDSPETREMAQKMAEKRYADANAKAAKRAAAATAKKPVLEAQEVDGRKEGAKYPKGSPIALRTSEPKYQDFHIEFEDPLDKAAYIITNRGKSAAHDTLHEWAHTQTTAEDLAKRGERVRNFLKSEASKGDPASGPLKVAKATEVKAKAAPSASERVAPSVTQTTRRTVSKTGEPAVSFKTSHSWIVYAKNTVGSLESAKLKKWLVEMIDNDPRKFVEDLHEHFFPEDLKKEGIWFEHQHIAGLGKEDPNFLAFMYNYTDKMPKEFAQALKYALKDTMKVNKLMNNGIDHDLQIELYAKNMWNHVAEFIHHPNYTQKGERNVFRTSYTRLTSPTKWDVQTLGETTAHEKDMIREMFKGKPAHMNNALTAHEALAAGRAKAFKAGDPDLRKKFALEIDDLLTEGGHREKLEF